VRAKKSSFKAMLNQAPFGFFVVMNVAIKKENLGKVNRKTKIPNWE